MIPKQSKLDRAIRIVFGLFLLSMMFWGPRSFIGIIGLIPLVTGLVGVRVLYKLLWIDPKDHPDEPRRGGPTPAK